MSVYISPGVGAVVALDYAIEISKTPIPLYHSLGGMALVEALYLFF